MALPNPGMVAVPFDIYTAEELNDTYANIEALADGSGLDDGAVTADKIDFATVGIDGGTFTPNTTTIKITTGFKPREVEFFFFPATATSLYESKGWSINTSSGIKHRSATVYGGGSSFRRVSSSAYSILLTNATSTFVQGAVTSFDDDGFTITMSSAGGSSEVFAWKAKR